MTEVLALGVVILLGALGLVLLFWYDDWFNNR